MNIGYISQSFFAVCLLPQVIKIFTAKTTKGISWLMWTFQALGYFFALLYGLTIHQWPITMGAVWGILCTMAFVAGYFKYRNQ